MSCLIYFETNWIVGAVMGQEPREDALLSPAKAEIRLATPSVCVMEAISAFDWKRIERNRLKEELDRQLTQLHRSANILIAKQLARELAQADLSNAKLLSELFQRLDNILVRVADNADLIPLSLPILQRQLQLVRETELDRDDALILSSILDHSRNQHTGKKAFITGNINDFQKPAVRNILAEANIKLFSSTEAVLGWALAGTKTHE